ncbi:hypothetical protein F2Q69_00025552 [Brassica cretica]|uniref:No apical meristem-associated C-terminal domain-containing protein n=1 Tax=Brassica cretica TaxID=69181 RepID=A0A8S9RWW2_BRACR|nr:hypothetical protein F2Q69_00025552 [Brassica cretica]
MGVKKSVSRRGQNSRVLSSSRDRVIEEDELQVKPLQDKITQLFRLVLLLPQALPLAMDQERRGRFVINKDEKSNTSNTFVFDMCHVFVVAPLFNLLNTSLSPLSYHLEATTRAPGVKAAKGYGKQAKAKGKTVAGFQRMWSIKKENMAMKERLSKMKLLDSLVAKKEPLADYEEALKKKLINELLLSN